MWFFMLAFHLDGLPSRVRTKPKMKRNVSMSLLNLCDNNTQCTLPETCSCEVFGVYFCCDTGGIGMPIPIPRLPNATLPFPENIPSPVPI